MTEREAVNAHGTALYDGRKRRNTVNLFFVTSDVLSDVARKRSAA